ncbi:hypothetical protein EJ04DRAFT_507896 [Polyplosphaeria fusca]|uniref:Uncharacterized protein n=1 Tax=Polyplosphaeria fusca TaxID=682080 RepID=A0A9P4R947_9PLEO|nr:hypothetical protein EJ04DRAFT_507896 [Polyplosphaeria fusca]
MGNTQSTGHQNRLSKPKTNTNSPAPVQQSPVSISSKYTDTSVRDRQLLETQLRSSVDRESASPRHSLDHEDGIGELATHIQAHLNLSRSNSAASQRGSGRSSRNNLGSLPDSRLSLVSSPQQVDLDTALKLIQEVRRTASPDDIAALQQALQSSPSPDSSRDSNARSSIFNTSASSLIRRRSLTMTPGLATRHSPTDSTRKLWNSWKRPERDPREAKWRVDMMGTSPLAKIASLDSADNGRESPTLRATTPGELDYSHLGSMKLGSLVVMNGAPSPAASARRVPRATTMHDASQEEDYFTASEGSASPVKRHVRQRAGGHSRSKSSIIPMTPPLHQELRTSKESRKAKTMSRCDSPLKLEVHSRQPFEFEDSESDSEPAKHGLHVVNGGLNKSAVTLAQDYMAEMPISPFKNSPESSPRSHDEGFVDSDDAASFREAAFRILDGTIFGGPAAETQETKAALVSVSTPESSRRRRGGRPTPRKADSGYSSGGSFRVAATDNALEKDAVSASPRPSLQKDSASVDLGRSGDHAHVDDGSSLYTFEQKLAHPGSKPLPPIPNNGDAVKRSTPLRLPDVEPSCEAEAGCFPLSPKTPQSVTTQVTEMSTETGASAQRKLQKRRPSMSTLPVVQSCPQVSEGSIPRVPDNVRAKFVRRLSESPAMECLTRTYPSKDHENSAEPASDSPVMVSIEFPSFDDSPAPRGRRHTRSQTERPPTPPPHGIRRSLSLFRKRSESRRKQEKGAEVENPTFDVVDLGTVASALGGSPYDAAMPMRPHAHNTVTSPTHPHQLGSLSRVKSAANMDAKTAADMARLRSKDRALSRPDMPPRPKSYHAANVGAGWQPPRGVYSDNSPKPVAAVSREPAVDYLAPAEATRGSETRSRSTGRGQVVSQMVNRFEQEPSEQPDWESHARLWSQRRKSIGEGLRQRAQQEEECDSARGQRASTQPPQQLTYDRYSGGYGYGYERGYGVGGSAGTRVLHSAASRKSMHYSHQFGVDLSDVPVFLQRVPA